MGQLNAGNSSLSEQQSNGEIGSLSRVLEVDGLSERQRLIQTGQITPFDTAHPQLPAHSSNLTTTETISTLSPHPSPLTTSSTLPSDHLLNGNSSLLSSTSNKSHSQSDSHLGGRYDNLTLSSLVGPSASDSTTTWGVKRKRPSPTLQLSNDSFDGLFSDPSPVTPPKTKQKRNSKRTSHKGKKKAQNDSTTNSPTVSLVDESSPPSHPIVSCDTPQTTSNFNSETLGGDTSTANSSHDNAHLNGSSSQASLGDTVLITEDQSFLPNSLNGEDEDMNADEWVPSIEEFENFDSEESYESEYYTDDELGGRRSKKKLILRPLSSDDLESDDEDHVTCRKRKKGHGNKKRKKFCRVTMKQRKHLDDGDEELYRMRIR